MNPGARDRGQTAGEGCRERGRENGLIKQKETETGMAKNLFEEQEIEI